MKYKLLAEKWIHKALLKKPEFKQALKEQKAIKSF